MDKRHHKGLTYDVENFNVSLIPSLKTNIAVAILKSMVGSDYRIFWDPAYFQGRTVRAWQMGEPSPGRDASHTTSAVVAGERACERRPKGRFQDGPLIFTNVVFFSLKIQILRDLRSMEMY